MKFLTVLCLVALAVGALALPAEKQTQKFPKKFDKSLHSFDDKKVNDKDSSYSSYVVSEDLDAMRLPPQSFQQGSYPDLNRRIPGFVFDPQSDSPKFILTAPVEDTYTNVEGVGMDDLVFPSGSDIAESNSYTIYNVDDSGKIHLVAPATSSYSMLSLEQIEELVNTPEAALSAAMQPPADTPKEVKVDSSYVTYDSNTKSSYINHDQPKEGAGEKLRPPPMA